MEIFYLHKKDISYTKNNFKKIKIENLLIYSSITLFCFNLFCVRNHYYFLLKIKNFDILVLAKGEKKW